MSETLPTGSGLSTRSFGLLTLSRIWTFPLRGPRSARAGRGGEECVPMRDAVVVALLVPLAYLLGTFPSAKIVARRRGRRHQRRGFREPGRVEHVPAPRLAVGCARVRARRREGRDRRRCRSARRRRPRRCLRARDRGDHRAHVPGDASLQGRPWRGDRRGRAARHLSAAHARERRRVARDRATHAQGVTRVDRGGHRVSRSRSRWPGIRGATSP